MVTTKAVGDDGEARALAHLQRHGLTLVQRNYRVAAGPRARGGEIDLILRDRDGTLVFVEVKTRHGAANFGGAAATVGIAKQRSLVLAAQHFLRAYATPPACRFDVVAIDGDALVWLPAAFDAY